MLAFGLVLVCAFLVTSVESSKSRCLSGYTSFVYHKKVICYQVISPNGNFTASQQACQTVHGRLMDPKSRRAFLIFYMKARKAWKKTKSPILVGLKCNEKRDRCKYGDGKKARLNVYRVRPGNKGQCMQLVTPYKRAEFVECREKFSKAICFQGNSKEKSPKKVLTKEEQRIGCREDAKGRTYSGKLAKTVNDNDCQRWSDQYPHSHGISNRYAFPEHSLEHNHCRNPDTEHKLAPWCLTQNPDVDWEYCHVPTCDTRKNCRRTFLGHEYVGTISVTKSGFECQRWDSQTPHEHGVTGAFFLPDRTMREAGNSCRNPDSSARPWCYTNNPGKRWEFCDVPICEPSKTCRRTRHGWEYMGDISRTVQGLTCQRWASQSPHKHGVEAMNLPEQSLEKAENFCRNPGSELAPWCYTEDPKTRWQYCKIPVCGVEETCRKTKEGFEYVGTVSVTTGGLTCQRWDRESPHKHGLQMYFFPDESLEAAQNYCRNPDLEAGPWCYTEDPNTRWQFCDIPYCQ